ncbi:CBS domain-containing protein [Lysobacter korlensis]|uniref:CBS domain-containing protein n=1 Tax=Lysobacter korlensis TaxID=553636 RepID=A0ABV6RU34_9GAMM
MTQVRELMTPDPEHLSADDTLVTAAQRMRDADVGSLPICDADGRVTGIVTDRDIVVKCIAEGGDPSSATVDSIASEMVYTVGPDDQIENALSVMEDHQVRRLPIVENGKLVGMLAQADVARTMSEPRVGEVVEEISR